MATSTSRRGITKLAEGRESFASIPEVMEMPYLLETQKMSYDEFLQFNVPPDMRENVACRRPSPASSRSRVPPRPARWSSSSTRSARPSTTVRECIERGMTYAVPLKVKLQLIVRETNDETNETEIKDIKEQETYMGEIPLMTEQGTFIINGAERVIV